ncbi:MAG: hypothetical protein GXP22_04850 [Gammaproteobacteria bacterium]|nr:hypothetical protein [Gammaproteobacteria bacterium]
MIRRKSYLLHSIWLPVFLLLWSAVNQARESNGAPHLPLYYTVEIIVFEQLYPEDSEVWPEIGTELDSSAMPLISNNKEQENTLPLPYNLLNSGWLSINDVWGRLKRSRPYHPLLYLSWYQPGVDRKMARKVYFYEGMDQTPAPPSMAEIINREINEQQMVLDEGMDTSFGGMITQDNSTQYFSNQSLATDRDDNDKTRGTVMLSVGLYLHLDLDIIFASEKPPLSTATAEQQITGLDSSFYDPLVIEQELEPDIVDEPKVWHYRLREQRKMRLNEIHYFDHPRFGVIAKVRRFDINESE